MIASTNELPTMIHEEIAACSAETGSPSTREAVGTFPLDALPESINRFTTECAASLSAAPELVAIPALVVTAAAIGNSRAISLKRDWTEPSSLFAAVVSPSGTIKSPALQMASKHLQELDTPERRTWTADVTVEQLARLLAANPRGLLLMRDELSAWVKSMNQYRQGKGADRQFYLSVWGGAPVKVDRKGTEESTAISIPKPCLSVVGCIPPDVVHDLDEQGGSDDGFLPRLLFAWPNPVPVRWSQTDVSQAIRDGYTQLIDQMFALPYEGTPSCLELTAEAQKCFIQWHDSHCAETERPSIQPFLRGSYAKLKGYCARLALIHALATDPRAEKVEKGSVEAAIRLVDYFKHQAAKAMILIGTNKVTDVDRCKGEIRRKLSVSRSMKKRELQKSSAFQADVFNQALNELKSPGVMEDSDGILHILEPTNRQVVAPRTRVAVAKA